jgi:hypothetical protein
MTSQINPNNIDGNYPVAGQDNNSQGFRDNFTNTSTNFQYAATEISDLQSKAVLKAALDGTSLNNNMNGSLLYNAQVQQISETAVILGTITGTVTVNFAAGSYQTVTTGGDISLAFTNFPAAGLAGTVAVQITVTGAYTLTLPTSVSVNTAVTGLVYPAGANPVIEFSAPGTYTFSFTTSNGGSTFVLNEINKVLQPFNNTKESVVTTNPLNLGVTTSFFTTAGTATLADGVEGQIKVLTQTAAASMVVTVADAGWKAATPGTSGTITLASRGVSCILQYTNSLWYCIGNNGATFG